MEKLKMAQDTVRKLLAHARDRFGQTGKIPAKLMWKIAEKCRRRYLFDFIAELGDKPTSSGFLRALSKLFPESERIWWMLILLSLRPPHSDPIHWQPSREDFRFFEMLLDEVTSLDEQDGDFRALIHYPLARIVDDVLMSKAFAGCGMESVDVWKTPTFYDHMLTGEGPSSATPGLLPIARAKALIARVLRIIKDQGLPRVQLRIGSAMLYYGVKDEGLLEAQLGLVKWLIAADVGPYLFYMVQSGLLAPCEGTLRPRPEMVGEVASRLYLVSGLFGPARPGLFVNALSCIEDKLAGEGYPPDNDCVDQCVASFVRWHESLGLFEALEAALAQ
jgi:hypothetical protein